MRNLFHLCLDYWWALISLTSGFLMLFTTDLQIFSSQKLQFVLLLLHIPQMYTPGGHLIRHHYCNCSTFHSFSRSFCPFWLDSISQWLYTFYWCMHAVNFTSYFTDCAGHKNLKYTKIISNEMRHSTLCLEDCGCKAPALHWHTNSLKTTSVTIST